MNRFRVRDLLFAGALCGALALAACRAGGRETDEVRLRLTYREGDTLLYAYHTTGTVEIPDTTEPSGRLTRQYERNMRVEEAVLDVTPRGNYDLAWTFTVVPDSGAESEPEPVRLTVEITPQGRILSVGGVETAAPLFGEIDFQSYFEQSQPVFPERPLKVGDSWTQEVKVLSPGSEPVVTSSTYVLDRLVREAGRPIVVIAYDGDIYLPVISRSAGDSAGPQLTSEERIRMRGEIFFAFEDGQVRRVETKADATFSRMKIQDGATVRRDMQIRETSRYDLIDR